MNPNVCECSLRLKKRNLCSCIRRRRREEWVPRVQNYRQKPTINDSIIGLRRWLVSKHFVRHFKLKALVAWIIYQRQKCKLNLHRQDRNDHNDAKNQIFLTFARFRKFSPTNFDLFFFSSFPFQFSPQIIFFSSLCQRRYITYMNVYIVCSTSTHVAGDE